MRNRRVFVVKYLNGFRRACLQPATAPDDDARISTPWRFNVRAKCLKLSTFLVAFRFLPFLFVALVFCFVCRDAVLSAPRSPLSPHLSMPQSPRYHRPELSRSNRMPVWTQ